MQACWQAWFTRKISLLLPVEGLSQEDKVGFTELGNLAYSNHSLKCLMLAICLKLFFLSIIRIFDF